MALFDDDINVEESDEALYQRLRKERFAAKGKALNPSEETEVRIAATEAIKAKGKRTAGIAGMAEDPRFGLAGKDLHTFLQKRKKQAAPGIASAKKKRGALESQRAEMERAQKAMGTILTNKQEKPSLLG